MNRLFLDIQNEAYKLTEQNLLSEEEIDNLVKEHLFPIGIFDFMDHVGLDTMLYAIKNYISHHPRQEYYLGLVNKLQALVDEGNLGLKTCKGFYTYQDGIKIQSSPSIPSSPQKDQEIIKYLKFTYLSTAKRFTMRSGCTIREMNDAIKEYFGMETGPFE